MAKGAKATTTNAYSYIDSTATCPTGKKAVGGGYSATTFIQGSGDIKANVTSNRPTEDGNGWYIRAMGVKDLTGYALCADPS